MVNISVIMATYNRAATLPRAIGSILNQTVKDIEVIIVDDGSIDGTQNLLSGYFKRDKRIKVITQSNQGLAVSRNIGVDNATGKYIAFMDSDDACAVNRLEVQLQTLLNNPDLDACAFSKLAPITDYHKGIIAPPPKKYTGYKGSPFNNKDGVSVLGPHSFMTRDSFLKVGGYRKQNTVIEDLDFTLRYSHYYNWGRIDGDNFYFYDAPHDNPNEGLVNQDVLGFAKRIVICYISEWCRINHLPDPIEYNKSQEELLAILNATPVKDKAIIYDNIRYFRRTISINQSMSNRESKNYLLEILGDGMAERLMINIYFKLFR